jgi:glycosyltransferase involved in cell wall biosynthesis
MQGAQAQSRKRGIGRYTLALIRAVVHQRGEHHIVLLLNGRFSESCQALEDEFSAQLGAENLVRWLPPAPVYQVDTANQARWKAAEYLYENVLGQLLPDIVLMTSLFEGAGDDAVTSIKAWRHDYPVATILFDLIPLLHPSPYLDNPAHARWYHEKVRHLKKADVLLSISEATRQEGLQHLSLPESGITNISSAIDDLFKPTAVSKEREHVLRTHYSLPKTFVMYTGGIDHRKNVEGLIRAFAQLPSKEREGHQLAVVCAVHEPEKERLQALAKRHGLAKGTLVLTDYVSEQDLLELYNLCDLFIFPSWHEGFGLPALEAMSCGAPVIAANTTSLPEVVGLEEALFDPHSDQAITDKMHQVLTDQAFRQRLKEHGLIQAQKFSWQRSADVALSAMAEHVDAHPRKPIEVPPAGRPRLAYISPLPPERSGISDYSAELLPELAHYYHIDLIVDQPEVAAAVKQYGEVRDVEWFKEHAADYDRVLYQFGNSAFHQHMFDLLEAIPGVVVLHDFFLSGIIAHREWFLGLANSWVESLYASHGYHAVAERCHHTDTADIVWRYPCNLNVLQQAQGVIVHSPNSLRLARRWVSPTAPEQWAMIPLLRQPRREPPEDKQRIRKRLNLPADALLIGSFGFIGSTKLNQRLLDAFLASSLADDPRCMLLFVGDTGQDEYGQQLLKQIRNSGLSERIKVTGWTDEADYHHYLAAMDVGVQLRTRSRGETSAAVLDCMNYGLATIVNANGSMADLPNNAVEKIADNFSDSDLIQALERVGADADYRNRLGQTAAQLLQQQHAPQACAKQYMEAIERAHHRRVNRAEHIAQTLMQLPAIAEMDDADVCQLATCLDTNFPESPRPSQLLLDITALENDAAAQPLAKALLTTWLSAPPAEYRIEPVYADEKGDFRYARHYALTLLECDGNLLADDPISPRAGDFWLGLELSPEHHQRFANRYQNDRRNGLHVAFAQSGELPGTLEEQLDTFAQLLPPASSQPQLWVDISELVKHDAKTGIQRVVRNILSEWKKAPPAGYTVNTIYATPSQEGYRRATQFALAQRGWPASMLPDATINPQAGDAFIGLDLQPGVVPAQRERYRQWRQQGVHTSFVVYDLLCIQHPEFFIEGGKQSFTRWLNVISESDRLVCISNAVANQLNVWLKEERGQEALGAEKGAEAPSSQPEVVWFHLGADMDVNEGTQQGEPAQQLASLLPPERQDKPTLLVVGTLEPRKAHAQVLAACEQLWQDEQQSNPEQDVNLVIVGKPGWRVDDIVAALAEHPQRNIRLFWWQECDDTTLNRLYQTSSGLLAASYDEGFGLPLIEAARHRLPILARDIPVFREVAGEHADYFSADTPEQMASAIADWLKRFAAGEAPSSAELPWQTWQISARQLAEHLPKVNA